MSLPAEAPEPAPVVRVACPNCGGVLDPPPDRSRLCPNCRHRIVVRHSDGHAIYLTEAAVEIFEAERQLEIERQTWTLERRRWLHLARAAGAPVELRRRRGGRAAVDRGRPIRRGTCISTPRRAPSEPPDGPSAGTRWRGSGVARPPHSSRRPVAARHRRMRSSPCTGRAWRRRSERSRRCRAKQSSSERRAVKRVARQREDLPDRRRVAHAAPAPCGLPARSLRVRLVAGGARPGDETSAPSSLDCVASCGGGRNRQRQACPLITSRQHRMPPRTTAPKSSPPGSHRVVPGDRLVEEVDALADQPARVRPTLRASRSGQLPRIGHRSVTWPRRKTIVSLVASTKN